MDVHAVAEKVVAKIINQSIQKVVESHITSRSNSETLSVTVCGHDGESLNLVITDAKESRQVLKSYAELENLYNGILEQKQKERLQDPAAKSKRDNSPSLVPAFPLFPEVVTAKSMTKLCQNVNEFFNSEFISRHEQLQIFLRQSFESSKDRCMTAIDFVLQPFQYEKAQIPRGSRHEVSLSIEAAKSVVVWKFEVEDFDIDFRVQFVSSEDPEVSEMVHSTTRYYNTSALHPIEGMFTCPTRGTATVVWDNSYSRLRGKSISYLAEVIPKSTMESAIQAADAFALASGKSPENILYSEPSVDPIPQVSTYSQLTEYSSMVAGTGSWIMSTAASTFFGGSSSGASAGGVSPTKNNEPDESYVEDVGREETADGSSEILKELDSLNKELMHRVENLEDSLAQTSAHRDQTYSECQLLKNEVESLILRISERDLEALTFKEEISRLNKERLAWSDVQAERDALLMEKHRWAIDDTFETCEETTDGADLYRHLSDEEKQRLEKQLGEAEALVIRTRAELGYAVSNHLTGNSTRLETIAKELAASKLEYETKLQEHETEFKGLKQQLSVLKTQKRVLVTEIHNLRRQSEGQVAVAMAEANEARMVNRRLKKQNGLLMKQLRSIMRRNSQEQQTATDSESAKVSEDTNETIPYTLTDSDRALLHGESSLDSLKLPRSRTPPKTTASYRHRLIEFFEEYDPSQLDQVDSMLASYKGVEEALFNSLELKYGYNKIEQ